eukprot:TRINITY_DN328_c1_g1_i1.p1 TRINITY_DN328_c1_g1~~TRINITY_DN328_c1_g1_i1.p1  ORF type:complete len:261 (+),score=49.80 TRINITY_DN328_c1_g1_i1:60-842(+)
MAEPRCVADLLADLKGGDGDKKSAAVVILFSVAHTKEVREAFIKDGEAVRTLGGYVSDISKTAHSVRWETLALLGELCRREHLAEPAQDQNKLAEALATTLSLHPSLKQGLEDCEKENTSASPIASDLLSSLPFPNITGWKTKAKDLCYLDPRLDQPWPRVTKADRGTCSGCNKKVEKSLRCSACKAVFYCGADCQVSHWKSQHKAACKIFKEKDAASPLANASKLFLPTRPQLYSERPKALSATSYDEYFFQYTQPEKA